MDLITRRIIADREGADVSAKKLLDYANPESTNYSEMVEEIRRQRTFTSLRFHRLDDMLEAARIDKCKLCTYCWDGRE